MKKNILVTLREDLMEDLKTIKQLNCTSDVMPKDGGTPRSCGERPQGRLRRRVSSVVINNTQPYFLSR